LKAPSKKRGLFVFDGYTLVNKSNVSSYITPEGHRRLSDELSYLWKIKRPRVTQAVADAAAMGTAPRTQSIFMAKSSYGRSMPVCAFCSGD